MQGDKEVLAYMNELLAGELDARATSISSTRACMPNGATTSCLSA